MTLDDLERKVALLRGLVKEMGLRGVTVTLSIRPKADKPRTESEGPYVEIRRLLERNGDAPLLGRSRMRALIRGRVALHGMVRRACEDAGHPRMAMRLTARVTGRDRTSAYHYEALSESLEKYDPDFLRARDDMERKYADEIEKIIKKYFAK